ncbi:hypothetical protein [Lysobacter sp. CA199]|uniref:hypothetical protein n=1 Tax=Lysobacter sp. CA199 TaxID=3455608 RepID=UPI003F8D6F28
MRPRAASLVSAFATIRISFFVSRLSYLRSTPKCGDVVVYGVDRDANYIFDAIDRSRVGRLIR